MTDIWSEALQGLQPRLGAQTYDLWLRPIALRQVSGTRLHLTAPNRFMKEWFENHYLGVVLDELRARTDQIFDVEIEVMASEPGTSALPGAPTPLPAPVAPPQKISPLVAPPPQLSGRYRFHNFIKGAGNELAASATWAAAQEPGRPLQPALHLRRRRPRQDPPAARPRPPHPPRAPTSSGSPIQSAERFMNEFISRRPLQLLSTSSARRYREDCDVLLIDDIQFIAGRDRTMDEFFHVFNALYEAGRTDRRHRGQDAPPRWLGMEERLTSRLNWGLVADIKPPDFETRAAILRQKAAEERIDLDPRDRARTSPPWSAPTSASSRARSGARDSTFAALKGRDDHLRSSSARCSADTRPTRSRDAVITHRERCRRSVAAHFSVRIADLKGPRRHQGIARPRMIAMYLSRQLTERQLPRARAALRRQGPLDGDQRVQADRGSIQSEEPRGGRSALRHAPLSSRSMSPADRRLALVADMMGASVTTTWLPFFRSPAAGR
jgi:chromosomal replication initiator protein